MKKTDLKETTLSRVFRYFHNKKIPVGIITAFRSDKSYKENVNRNKVLANKITSAKYGYFYVEGHWQDKSDGNKAAAKEDSIFIVGGENDNGKLKGLLKKWIREYNQDAALFKDEGTTSIALLEQSGNLINISNNFSLKKIEIGYTRLRGRGKKSFSFDEEREGLGWLGQMIEKIGRKKATMKEGLSECVLSGPELTYYVETIKEKDINSIQKLSEYFLVFSEEPPDMRTSHLVLGSLESDKGNILDTVYVSIENSDESVGDAVDFIRIKNTGKLINEPKKGEVVFVYFYYYNHATYELRAHKKIKNICPETKSFQGEAIITKTDDIIFELIAEDASGGGEYRLQILFNDGDCLEGTVGNKDELMQQISDYLTDKGVIKK
jgi:hypothetical protein|tara:strand:+ start:2711 stop:3850 length:1140 start_codon:yes stop_codon:yes gene_type:complete